MMTSSSAVVLQLNPYLALDTRRFCPLLVSSLPDRLYHGKVVFGGHIVRNRVAGTKCNARQVIHSVIQVLTYALMSSSSLVQRKSTPTPPNKAILSYLPIHSSKGAIASSFECFASIPASSIRSSMTANVSARVKKKRLSVGVHQ